MSISRGAFAWIIVLALTVMLPRAADAEAVRQLAGRSIQASIAYTQVVTDTSGRHISAQLNLAYDIYVGRDHRFFVRSERRRGQDSVRLERLQGAGELRQVTVPNRPMRGIQAGWSENGNTIGLVLRLVSGFNLITITVHGRPATSCEIRAVWNPDAPGGSIVLRGIATGEVLTLVSVNAFSPTCTVSQGNIFVRQQQGAGRAEGHVTP